MWWGLWVVFVLGVGVNVDYNFVMQNGQPVEQSASTNVCVQALQQENCMELRSIHKVILTWNAQLGAVT